MIHLFSGYTFTKTNLLFGSEQIKFYELKKKLSSVKVTDGK